MGRAAQAVQRAVDAARSKKKGGRRSAKETATRARRAKSERKPAARRRAAKAEQSADGTQVQRNPLAGLKSNPKGKNLFVNTAGALAVMLKALEMLLATDVSDAERADASRLVARLKSRGVGAE